MKIIIGKNLIKQKKEKFGRDINKMENIILEI
jgi:hypothetical protein